MRKLKLMKTLLVVAAMLGGGSNAWASTTYTGSMYNYDVVFGTPDNATTPTAINVQTDFTTDNSTQSQTMLTLSIDGSVLAGNQAGGRTYAFSTAPTTGTVTFKATGKFIGGNYDFFHIQGTKEEGGETSSYNIVSSPYSLPSSSALTTVLRIFGENINASYVYTPRDVLYSYDVTIDLDKQKVSYSITYASKGSSGNVSQLSTLEGNVNVPDGITLKSVTGLNMPRCGQNADSYYDNVAFYSAVSNETLYTATFTETNSLDPTVKIYSDAGRSVEVSNGELRDQTTYYYRATLHGYQDYEDSFSVNGANPSVSYTMTAAEAVASLKVYAKVNNINYLIKTVDLVDKYVGDNITFCYPRLWLVGTTLYETAQEAHTAKEYYKWSNYTLTGNSVEIEYNSTFATNVVYFSEGENITGMTADASSNGDIRCSDGQGGRSSSECSLLSLGTGVYKLTSRVWGNAGTTFTYRAAGSAILEQSTVGYLDDKTVNINVVSGSADITVQGSESLTGKVIDYVYIQKLDDASEYVYNGDFESSTWNDGWNGTGSDKAKAFAKQTSSQTWGATGNFAEMWTNSSFSVEANLYQTLVNVPAGTYTLSADILNSVSSSGGVLYAKVGSASDVTTAAENASGAKESVSFTVTATSNVVVGFKTTAISTKNGWIAVDNFDLQQVVPATLGTNGYGTFASTYPLDLTTAKLPDGVTAYKAAVSGTTVTFTELNQTVPANTGVLLKGTASATVNIPVAAAGTDVEGNAFLVNTTGATFTGDNDYYYFGLMKNTLTFGVFDPSTVVIPADKAYLKVLKTSTSRSLNIVFSEETGISQIENGAEKAVDAIFDLQGRRVAQPQKGLYIVNGKKTLVK